MKRWVWLSGLLFLALFLAIGTPVRGAPPVPAPVREELLLTAGVVPIPNVRVRFEGPIQSSTAGVPGIWTVAGYQVQVGAETVIEPAGAQPQTGDRALVRALYLEGAPMKAFHITITKAALYQPELVEFSGSIQAQLPQGLLGEWIVNSIHIEVSETTNLLPAGVQPNVGDRVHVQAWRQVDGRITAQTVQVELIAPGCTRVQFEGLIEQYPAAPYTGSWRIAGVPVQVASDRAITGRPARGLVAEVDALARPDGTVLAERICILEPSVPFADIEGAIQALPAQGLLGTWVVGGQPIAVTADTLIDESRAQAGLGQWAVVRVQQPKGSSQPQALRIRLERARENGPEIEFAGIIESLPPGERIGTWRVGGVSVAVARETQISGVPLVGGAAWARIRGSQANDGRIRALAIAITYPWAEAVAYPGTIEAIPDGFFGVWRLSGQQGETMAHVKAWATIKGTPRPGAQATVRGIWLPDSDGGAGPNLILAFEVEVEGESAATQVVGKIEGAPAPLLGVWRIASAVIYIHAGTELAGDLKEGTLASVTGVPLADGHIEAKDSPRILALRVEALDETRQ